jgi:hypothetical protein
MLAECLAALFSVDSMRHPVTPVYGTVATLKRDSRLLQEARFLIGFIVHLEKHAGSVEDLQYSARATIQRCLNVSMQQIHEHRNGFPCIIPGTETVCFMIPKLGLVHCDIVQARDVCAVHAHHSIRCGTKAYFGKGHCDDATEDGLELPVGAIDPLRCAVRF